MQPSREKASMSCPSKHTRASAVQSKATAPSVAVTRSVKCSSVRFGQLRNTLLPSVVASTTKLVTPLFRKALSPILSRGTALQKVPKLSVSWKQ